MLGVTRLTALVLAIALCAQMGARAACEAVCLTNVASTMLAPTASSPQCHSAQLGATLPSASLVGADDNCEHATTPESFAADRSHARNDRPAVAAGGLVAIVEQAHRGIPTTVDPINAPPGGTLGTALPLRI